MTPTQLAKKYSNDIDNALKKFGAYQFDDRGPTECMDLSIKELKSLSVFGVSETLRLVLAKFSAREWRSPGRKFMSSVLVAMQDWDKFDELMKNHKWLKEYF